MESYFAVARSAEIGAFGVCVGIDSYFMCRRDARAPFRDGEPAPLSFVTMATRIFIWLRRIVMALTDLVEDHCFIFAQNAGGSRHSFAKSCRGRTRRKTAG